MATSMAGKSAANRAFVTGLAAAVILAALAQSALANIGSSIIYGYGESLIPANLFIAAVEAGVAWLIFRTAYMRALGIMILGNFCSVMVGFFVLIPAADRIASSVFSGPRIFYLYRLWLLAFAISLVLTVMLEWPFGYWVLKGVNRRVMKSIVLVLAAHLVSYTFLWPNTWHMRRQLETITSCATGDAEMAANRGARIYYLDNTHGDLRTMALGSADSKLVCAAGITDEAALLIPRRDKESGVWQLWAATPGANGAVTMLVDDIAPMDDPSMKASEPVWSHESGKDGPSVRRRCFDLRSSDGRRHEWDANAGGFGLQLTRPDRRFEWPWQGESLYLYYRTTYHIFDWRSLTVLPGDEAVVAVDGQILLVDIHTGRIALLAMGHSPCVLPLGASPR